MKAKPALPERVRSMEGLGVTFRADDCLVLAGTPLLFAGNSILVAIHLRARAVRKKVRCLCAGFHLRAGRSPVAGKACGGRRIRRRRSFGWGRRSGFPLLLALSIQLLDSGSLAGLV